MRKADDRPLAKPIWIDRFGTRLMELRSGMNAVTAAQLAVASYTDASGLDPEDAADTFAAVRPTGDVEHPRAMVRRGSDESFDETTPGAFRRRPE